MYRQWLSQEAPLSSVSPDVLAGVFSVFSEWKLLDRSDKRRLLSCLVPEIRVANYEIYGISLLSAAIRGDEKSHAPAATGATAPANAIARKP
jgi:hypothetical protein